MRLEISSLIPVLQDLTLSLFQQTLFVIQLCFFHLSNSAHLQSLSPLFFHNVKQNKTKIKASLNIT